LEHADRPRDVTVRDPLDRPQVEHEAAVLDAGQDPRLGAPERGRGA
jgi:hypothetical protein